jgi:hypothetical protein
LSRKSLALLPLYMLAMLTVATIGLTASIVGFIPMMIWPRLVTPIRDQIMNRFTMMMGQVAAKQFAKGFHP